MVGASRVRWPSISTARVPSASSLECGPVTKRPTTRSVTVARTPHSAPALRLAPTRSSRSRAHCPPRPLDPPHNAIADRAPLPRTTPGITRRVASSQRVPMSRCRLTTRRTLAVLPLSLRWAAETRHWIRTRYRCHDGAPGRRRTKRVALFTGAARTGRVFATLGARVAIGVLGVLGVQLGRHGPGRGVGGVRTEHARISPSEATRGTRWDLHHQPFSETSLEAWALAVNLTERSHRGWPQRHASRTCA